MDYSKKNKKLAMKKLRKFIRNIELIQMFVLNVKKNIKDILIDFYVNIAKSIFVLNIDYRKNIIVGENQRPLLVDLGKFTQPKE